MKKTRKTKHTTDTTELGQSVIRGMRDAIAFMRGDPDHGCIVHVPKEINVKAIREKVYLSQEQFAERYGFSKRTLEHWEQGRRVPTGASRAFLMVIAREPEAVSRALMG